MEQKENSLSQLFANSQPLPDDAAASNELIQKQLSQSNNSNTSNGGRRVSNRRVSFAATAHVHTFTGSSQNLAVTTTDDATAAPSDIETETEPGSSMKHEVPVKAESADDSDESFSSFNSEEELMMEFTNCVGGLIVPATQEAEETTMDLTKCVGGLIMPVALDATRDDDEDEEITLSREITRSKESPFSPNNRNPIVDSPMDMTACVGRIKSPSPFLVANEETPVRRRYSSTPATIHEDVNMVTAEVLKGTPPNNNESFDAETATMDLTQVIQEAIMQKSTLTMVSPLAAPKASLKDFLSQSGIRFLDNLASLARRETMVMRAARDSSWFNSVGEEERGIYAQMAIGPELAVFEGACADLTARVLGLREVITGQEHQFNHAPPAIYEDPSPGTKLKTLKTVSRLHARQSWYEWRQARQEPLLQTLSTNLDIVQREVKKNQVLAGYALQANQLVQEMRSERDALEARHFAMQSIDLVEAARLEAVVKKQTFELNTIDDQVAEASRQEAMLRASIEDILREKQALLDRLDVANAALKTVMSTDEGSVEELQGQLGLLTAVQGWRFAAIRPDFLALDYRTSNNNHGGCVRVGLSLTRKLTARSGAQAVVSGVTLEGSNVKGGLFAHLDCVVRPTFKTVPKTVRLVMAQLDRLGLLQRELLEVSVQCQVSILDNFVPSSDRMASAQAACGDLFATQGGRRSSLSAAEVIGIPIQLSFFSFERRIKFDTILIAFPMLLRLHSTEIHYGELGASAINDLVGNVLSSSTAVGGTVKRLVTALNSLILG